jgi:hypothetical protein
MRVLVPAEVIERKILLIRGQRVILDTDLAKLYGVATFRFNEQVKRNQKRFPEDFMFQLTKDEYRSLISQFAISKPGRGGRRSLPKVFTEHGALMAANILKSQKAIEASIYVVRAFVKLREMLSTHRELAQKLSELERKLTSHDTHIQTLFDAIRQLMAGPQPKEKKIGFRARESMARYKVAGRKSVKANDGSMLTANMPE